MTDVHTRSAGGAEVLGVDFAERIITVVCVPYNEWAHVVVRGERWREQFVPGSFAALNAIDPTTVRVCREHDRSDVVGKVLRFDTSSAVGLIAEVKIARTQRGDDTLALADERCLSASVGYLARSSGIELDQVARTRTVRHASLDHVGLVMSPAFSGAQVLSVRDYSADPVMVWAAWRLDPTMRWVRNRLR